MDAKELAQVLLFTRPSAEFMTDNDSILWLDKKQSQPTQAEIDAGLIAYNSDKSATANAEATAKTAAQAKLAALGLTTDDLKALGL